jgi:hypothetical protein
MTDHGCIGTTNTVRLTACLHMSGYISHFKWSNVMTSRRGVTCGAGQFTRSGARRWMVRPVGGITQLIPGGKLGP